LQKLAESYTFNVVNQDSRQSGVHIADSVWDVRSLLNQADCYYVLQEADYWNAGNLFATTNADTECSLPRRRPLPGLWCGGAVVICDLFRSKATTFRSRGQQI